MAPRLAKIPPPLLEESLRAPKLEVLLDVVEDAGGDKDPKIECVGWGGREDIGVDSRDCLGAEKAAKEETILREGEEGLDADGGGVGLLLVSLVDPGRGGTGGAR